MIYRDGVSISVCITSIFPLPFFIYTAVFISIDMTTLLNRYQEIVMLITREEQHVLNTFFETLKLRTDSDRGGITDKSAKIEQILAYLEVMHAQIRHYSKKRDLVFIDSGAGNCYLSFLVYYFYTRMDDRRVQIHCLDINHQLMEKNRRLAEKLNFDRMYFHASDIAEYTHEGRVDMAYSLHACDSATDKALYLGLKNRARHIFSVSCCQHTLFRQLRRHPYTGMTRHRVFKEKLTSMVGDALRALLLEMEGYKVDVLEFVSSRHTDKNIMIRAKKEQLREKNRFHEEYAQLQDTFHVTPSLEHYIK